MAGTEDITLRVALDERQAKAGLDALRAQTEAVAAAADSGAGGLGKLQQRVDGVNKVAGPAASAISGVTGAVGGLSSQAGAAVGAVANLAGAFASGGPLALAIVGIGTGVSWLTSKYQESSRAAEKAAQDQIKAAKATSDRIEGLTKGLESRIQAAMGIDDATLALGQLEIKVKAAQQELNNLQTQAGRSEFMRLQAITGNAVNSSDAYAQAVEKAQQRLADFDIELANAEGAYEAYNEKLALAVSLEAKKKEADDAVRDALTKKTAAVKKNTEAVEDAAEVAREYVDQRRKQIMDETAAIGPTREMFQQAQVERARKAAQEAEKEHTRILQEESKKQQKASDDAAKKRQEDAQATAGYVSAFTGIIVGQSQQLIDDLIMGQEKAFERFFAGVMKQAGTVLIGKGIELVGSGAANLLLGNPAGAAQLAVGGSMIAGGVTLGGIGSGIERGLMGGSGSTAGTAGPSPATTATPMGAGRITSGGRDGGGPMQEAITYVFNAPVFGDQNRSAKQVAMLQRRARRDLLLA
jgi:hypothetical protein